MTDSSSLLKSLVVYAVCLPVAILLGYLLAVPTTMASFNLVMAVLGVMAIPLLLQWHHLWLIAVWNMSAVFFFLPGQPSFMFVLCAISMAISIGQHALNRSELFISVPTINKPLIFITIVVLVTAKLTGGIGLAIAGGSTMGGKRYIWLLSAVAGYYALTARSIPRKKAGMYLALFIMGMAAIVISDLAVLGGPPFYFLLNVFPPDMEMFMQVTGNASLLDDTKNFARLGGPSLLGAAVFTVMLALYGIKGIFDFGRPWRLLVLMLTLAATLFGGYRSMLISLLLTFALVFYYEGMMRSRLLVAMVLLGILGAAIAMPFTNKLPLAVQRTISFIPYVQIDPIAANAAKSSTEWRLEMWQAVLPEVPKYLLLGKGYSINPMEFEMAGMSATSQPAEAFIMAGDYHSGPLSVVMPFGIAGIIGFCWIMGAGIKLLYRNYRYGDADLKRINTFLLASFIAKLVVFIVIFGSLYSDLAAFTGLIGLSVCMNGGMRQPARRPQAVAQIKFRQPRTQAVATR